MEHPCSKCGAPVEDGVPFCKACRAPQIRVPGFEASEPIVLPEIHGVAEPASVLPPPPAVAPRGSPRIQWSLALPGAAIGGVLSLVFSLFVAVPMAALLAGPSAGLLVLGFTFMVGGAWSARVYYRKVKKEPASPIAGAQVGLASGGFGFLFFAVGMIASASYGADKMRTAMSDAFAQLIKTGYDPENARQALDLLKTPEGLAAFVAFVLFFMLLIFVIGASIGGAWYSAWLRKHTRV